MLNTPVPEAFTSDWWFVIIIGSVLLYDLFTDRIGLWRNAINRSVRKDGGKVDE